MGSAGIEVDLGNIEAIINKQVENYINSVIYKLQYIGDSALKEAKDRGDYIDRSGNLRSSVGYVIVYNGKIHYTSAFTSLEDGRGEEGTKIGQKYAKELATEVGENEIALILVAGMNYAKYVASKRDVLDSAEIIAKGLLKDLFKD